MIRRGAECDNKGMATKTDHPPLDELTGAHSPATDAAYEAWKAERVASAIKHDRAHPEERRSAQEVRAHFARKIDALK